MKFQLMHIKKLMLRTIFMVMLSLLMRTECVLAQDPGPINTERPSFSSSPLALTTGLWQIESGYVYTRNVGSNSSKEQTLPNALLRFGFHPRFELQLNWAGYSRMTSQGSSTSGLKDASLGVKWQIIADDAPFVAAVFAGVTLPVGDKEFTSDDYDPEFAVFWTYSGVLEWFGTAKLTESDNKYKIENALGINFSLAQDTGAYVEYKGTFPEGQGPAHDLNFGVTWLLSNDLQVDLNGALGLNKRASDFTLGTGIAYRF
ncbi:transporter [Pseudomonadota bacterium]